MCGICGVYQFKNLNKTELKEAVEKMNQRQARRGPDDEGVFIDKKNGVAFGHRRLSILDLSKAGHQPMVFNLWTSDVHRTSDVPILIITFNGEIYNFQELKNDLEKKGYKFKTKTDTEVILALYAEYGEKSFAMLRGMFAFGLYDVGNRKVFLVKDRYGIKPLYYYTDSEKLVFASTVKAITESGLISVIKNPSAFIGFLLFGSVPLPMTTVKNVFAVPAGHYLEISADGDKKLIQYYEPLNFFNIWTSDVHILDVIQEIRYLLEDSVRLHLISDAPLGVFLSGGLDSSVIAALANFNMGKSDLPNINVNFRRSDFQKLITLSIIFDEPEFSEQKYQRLVAQKIKSDHREVKITAKNFNDSFGEIFEAMDQPTIDGVNTFFIAKAAKQAGLKTVLSGLGADEIFLGYPHFKKAEMLRKIQNLPKILKSPLKLGNLFGDRYSKLSYFANDDILSFYLGIRGLFSPQETAKILDIGLSEVNNFISNIWTSDILNIDGNIRMSDVRRLNPVNLLSYLELKFYLQNQLLKDTDFMSMYHSVEVRVPFLDHKLAEYVSSLLPEIKLNIRTSDVHNVHKTSDVRNINKPLLVAAVRDLLPQGIFTRPKMGFTFPFQKWFSESPQLQTTNYKLQTTRKTHWSRDWARVALDKFIM